MGLGYGLSAGAGGMADALQGIQDRSLEEVLAHKRFEQLQQQAMRQQSLDAERRQQWDADHQLRTRSADSLEAQREAAAAATAAEAKRRADRDAELERFSSDPNAFAGMTPLQRHLNLNRHGVANIGIHDVETPEEHTAHSQGEKDAAFTDWQRRSDYTEQQRRARPVRALGVRLAPGQDDPALPRGVQAYLGQLRTKHPTFEAAAGELNRHMQEQIRAHPSLSPERALDALRGFFVGSGERESAADALIQQTLAGSSFGGARGGGGGGGARSVEGPGGGDDVEAQLMNTARTALRQRLGRDASDEEVQTILSNPKNRALLLRQIGGGGQ